MSNILTEASDARLVNATEQNAADLFALLGRLPSVERTETPELLRLCTGLPYPLGNGIFRTKLTAAGADARIGDELAHFQQRHLPIMWMVEPSATPADLPARLTAQGFTRGVSDSAMAASLDELTDAASVPAGAQVSEVTGEDELRQWVRALSDGMEMPLDLVTLLGSVSTVLGYGSQAPLRNFAVSLNGEMAGTSTLYVGAGVAGIYNVSVLRDARRRGLGAAVTLAAMRAARELGFRYAILLATAMGERIYAKLGFRAISQFTFFFHSPPAPGASGGHA